MPQQLLKKEYVYLPIFKLDDEFQSDKVDISIFDCYKNTSNDTKTYWLKHNKSSTIWDFSIIKNPNIKLEYKFFIQEKIKSGIKLGTLVGYKRTENLFVTFLNNKYTNCISITEVSVEEYHSFLFLNNIKEKTTYYKISKDMEKIKIQYTRPPYLIISQIQNFITEFNERNIPELQKDSWCIDKLPFKVDTNDCKSIKNLNFSTIKQDKIKDSIKFYTELRLHTKALQTVHINLSVLCQFFAFIDKSFPNVKHLSDLTRDMIERYIAFMRTSARDENYIASQLGTLNTFFEYMQLCEDIEDKPDFCLILKSDYKQNKNQDVRFFTDNEMQRIFAHIDELDDQIARMLYVHANAGMRISELCLLKIEQIEKVDEETYWVYIDQNKTKAENKIYIQKLSYEILQKAYKVSCEKFGENTKYIFAQNKTKPIRPITYSTALNKMSYDNNLKFDDGTPLHITSHTFRATLATKLATLGLDIDVVNKILGHSSKTAIKSYVAITTDDYIKYLDKHLLRQGEWISNIGKKEKPALTKAESVVSLDNGFCSKTGSPCESANACLTCSMFVPSKKHLNKYKTHLQSVEQHILICKKNNLTKELEFNLEQKRLLERIISKLQEEN